MDAEIELGGDKDFWIANALPRRIASAEFSPAFQSRDQ